MNARPWVERGADGAKPIVGLMLHRADTDERVYEAFWPAGTVLSPAERWAAEARGEGVAGVDLDELVASWVTIMPRFAESTLEYGGTGRVPARFPTRRIPTRAEAGEGPGLRVYR